MSKRINLQNWLERDDILNSFVVLHPTEGNLQPITQQEWAELLLKPQLLVSVPGEVQRLFEGARAALVYGYFYYGLCFMGMIALFRVAETALIRKCQELDASSTPTDFDASLHWLASRGIVQPADWAMIADARTARFYPQDIITVLEQLTDQINTLFPLKTS